MRRLCELKRTSETSLRRWCNLKIWISNIKFLRIPHLIMLIRRPWHAIMLISSAKLLLVQSSIIKDGVSQLFPCFQNKMHHIPANIIKKRKIFLLTKLIFKKSSVFFTNIALPCPKIAKWHHIYRTIEFDNVTKFGLAFVMPYINLTYIETSVTASAPGTKALKLKCSNLNISANSWPISIMLGLFFTI